MRIPLVLVLATSCAQAPCPLSACGAVCPDVAQAKDLVLQPWQAAVLKPDLDDLRAGVQFQGPPQMCAIDTACAAGSLPETEELGEDPIDLYVTYRTPKLARAEDWRGKFKMSCADVIPGAHEALERPRTSEEALMVEATHGEWKTWLFHRVQFYSIPVPQRCVWSLELYNPDGLTTKADGHFLRAAHVDAPDRSLGFSADGNTPGVTVIPGPKP